MSLIFALDFDNTVSSDVDLWRKFVADAQERKHYVMVVTARRHDFDNTDIEQALPGIEVVTTNGAAKRKFLQDNGYPSPSVWIDDMPELIVG